MLKPRLCDNIGVVQNTSVSSPVSISGVAEGIVLYCIPHFLVLPDFRNTCKNAEIVVIAVKLNSLPKIVYW